MRRNDSDVHRNSRRSTRRSPRLLEKEEVVSGICFLLETDLLSWRDDMALGSTCKTAQDTWKMTRDVHMLPLLNVLEKILGNPNEDELESLGLEISLRDGILRNNYDNFSIYDK